MLELAPKVPQRHGGHPYIQQLEQTNKAVAVPINQIT